jgi:inner membrane protein
VDPIAHTFLGGALAATGLRRATRLATAALLIGANVPDVDVLTSFAGNYASLAMRRGWTHGVPALVVWPFVVTGLLLAWDRWRRRGAGAAEKFAEILAPSHFSDRAPARAGPLFWLSALAVVSHPTLDWLNNYGMRWLMPFDGRWSYGDALFIVDPWVWLALGGVVFLVSSRSPWAFALWLVFWLAGTWLLLTAPFVPPLSRALWGAGVLAVLALRLLRGERLRAPPVSERVARSVLGCVVAYMAAALAASAVARREVRAELAARGISPVTSVMVGPVAANPFAGAVVAATPAAYHLGEWHWFAQQRLTLLPPALVRRDGDPAVAAASATRDAQHYLTWSRYPYFEIESRADGYLVRMSDVRYRAFGQLEGPAVRLDRSLRPIPEADRNAKPGPKG